MFRWARFRLRTLLLFAVAVAAACSWFVVPALRQRAAVARVLELAAQDVGTLQASPAVIYQPIVDIEKPPTLENWIRYRTSLWFGDECCRKVKSVQLVDSGISDDELKVLSDLPDIQSLQLENTLTSNFGLHQITRCTKIETLNLSGTCITDEGIAKLHQLAELRRLYLRNTELTDASIAELSTMNDLRVLSIHNTFISQSGYERLQAALPNCQISPPRREWASGRAYLP